MIDVLPSDKAIRAALARQAYDAGKVRICDHDLRGYDCLVASRQGLFAVNPRGAKRIAYGHFFGVSRFAGALLVFEACDRTSERSHKGRLVRLELSEGRIEHTQVIAKGLDNQCHQLAVIEERICVVDTANQSILRFAIDGSPIDVRQPFAAAPREDTSGLYLHLNAIAAVRGRVVLMLHNGTAIPRRPSELAWLDQDWKVERREALPGFCCHDIVEDHEGTLWHCGSRAGEIFNSAGLRRQVSSQMTRGFAITREGPIVGTSMFGPRQLRPDLVGSVLFLDWRLNERAEVELPAAPTDLVAL